MRSHLANGWMDGLIVLRECIRVGETDRTTMEEKKAEAMFFFVDKDNKDTCLRLLRKNQGMERGGSIVPQDGTTGGSIVIECKSGMM